MKKKTKLQPQPQLPSEVTWIISLLISIMSSYQIAISLQAPIFSIFIFHLLGDLRHIGIIIGIYGLSFSISSNIASRFWLKYNFKLLYLSYTGFALYCFLLYLHPSTWEIYFLQILGGFFIGLGWAVQTFLFVKSVDDDLYPKYNSLGNLVGRSLGFGAAILSGFVAHHLGMETVFLFMAGVSIISLLLILFLHRFMTTRNLIP